MKLNESIMKNLKENDNALEYSYNKRQILDGLLKNADLFGSDFTTEDEDATDVCIEIVKDIVKIESEQPMEQLEQNLSNDFIGFRYGIVRTYLKDGRIFEADEEDLPLVTACECVLSKQINECDKIKEELKGGTTMKNLSESILCELTKSARRIKGNKDLIAKSRRKAKKLNESSVLDVDGSSDLNDIMESDEVMYIINVYDNADIDVGQIIHDYTSNLMRLDIDAVKKALSDWASDIRERMGDM